DPGISKKRRGKMASTRGNAGEHDGPRSRSVWDPLVYLKPASRAEEPECTTPQAGPSHVGGRGKSLGMLLTSLDCQPQWARSTGRLDAASPDAVSALRRRRPHPAETPGEHGSQAAASIIDAEGTQGPGAQRNQYGGVVSQMKQTLHQVRDYFLAEFRPAAPILDLTYDRLYSQGIEDDARPAHAAANCELLEDNGDTILPFRQLIGRVLPRSMSRVLGPEPDRAAGPRGMLAAAATAPPVTRTATSPRSVSPDMSLFRQTQERATTRTAAGGAGLRRGALWRRRGRSSHDIGHAPQPAALGGQTEWTYSVDKLGELPHPPRAPWLADEAGAVPPPMAHSRSTSHPALAQAAMCRSSSVSDASLASLDGQLAGRRSCHKNSLPLPRLPLTARMVSELNYVSRRSTTPGCLPASIPRDWTLPLPAEESAGDLLLAANYQRFAVERQSKFEPDDYTDYSQTPMLNFRGILDRGIQDYVHPGLIGELPTLWLPVRERHDSDNDGNTRTDTSSSGGDSAQRPPPASQLIAQEPYRRIAELLRTHAASPDDCPDSVAAVVAAAAAAATRDELVSAGFDRSQPGAIDIC
ncbi:hypothetical protein H4R19_005498, partial [Coemansia spiralis]